MEDFQLCQGFLHLMDSTGAVNEFDWIGWFGKSITSNKGEKCYGFPGSSRHFQQAVALGIKGSFKFHHVSILLRVYMVIRKVDCHIFYLKLHPPLSIKVQGGFPNCRALQKPYSILPINS
uniref:Uncharacterized protein n=1 Tax=Opuntia streptacantha TaxID=393608 RepID=A0A7C9E046_OPUST